MINDFVSPLKELNGYLFLVTIISSLFLGFRIQRLKPVDRKDFSRWYPHRCLIFSLYLSLAIGVWFGLEQISSDGKRGFLASNLEPVSQIQAAMFHLQRDVTQIKEVTVQTRETMTVVGSKIDELHRKLTETIGTQNLGPQYENTYFHRQYQDEYLKNCTFREFMHVRRPG